MADPTPQFTGGVQVHQAWARLMRMLSHHTAASLARVHTASRRMKTVVR